MDHEGPIDEVVRQINGMSRQRCIFELLHFDHIPLDFRRGDLDTMSVERLRHTLVAAVVTVRKRSGRARAVRAGRCDGLD